MERMTAENYYFGFQTKHDGGAVCRFIAQPIEEKFSFKSIVYSPHSIQNNLVAERQVPRGITVHGGLVGVFDELFVSNKTFASNQVLNLAGDEKQRFIGRIFVPGSGTLSPPTRDIFGSVGFMRLYRNRTVENPDAKWLSKVNILEGWLRDDSIFGLEYDASTRSLNVTTFGFSRVSRSQSSRITISAEDADSGDPIVLAIELTTKAAKEHTLLSVRKCDSDETWTRFIEHLPSETPPAELADDALAAEFFELEDHDPIGRGGGMVRRIRRRVEHMNMRVARRHLGQNDGAQAADANNEIMVLRLMQTMMIALLRWPIWIFTRQKSLLFYNGFRL
jgi:hypothetical protein